MGTVEAESEGCVNEQCSALRYSVSWKAESISMSSVSGGPSVMSSAFVPGRILRDASAAPLGNLGGYNDSPGDVGPLWSSAIGGGEGRRGEEEGETGVAMVVLVVLVDQTGCEESGKLNSNVTPAT